MRHLFLSLLLGLFCIGQAIASSDQQIRISTNETDLILQVAPNGRLYQSYLGSKLRHQTDLTHLAWNVHSSTDGSVTTRGWEVYPASGMEDYFEPAFAIQHNDGNMTSLFTFVSSETRVIDANASETIIQLKDEVYPLEDKLHYISYAKENVIKAWTELRHT
ncbi:MAG: glycoside hydrolase family 36 N-terminal domain-containing protein [bacterium]|nr:glycoside hydrolase family 36 N-terminal domain-containing protein [bacterium]